MEQKRRMQETPKVREFIVGNIKSRTKIGSQESRGTAAVNEEYAGEFPEGICQHKWRKIYFICRRDFALYQRMLIFLFNVLTIHVPSNLLPMCAIAIQQMSASILF
jgi:hypothetical protein